MVYFYDICERYEPHKTTQCMYNADCFETKWFGICQMTQHNMDECIKNLKNKNNYHTIYHM